MCTKLLTWACWTSAPSSWKAFRTLSGRPRTTSCVPTSQSRQEVTCPPASASSSCLSAQSFGRRISSVLAVSALYLQPFPWPFALCLCPLPLPFLSRMYLRSDRRSSPAVAEFHLALVHQMFTSFQIPLSFGRRISSVPALAVFCHCFSFPSSLQSIGCQCDSGYYGKGSVGKTGSGGYCRGIHIHQSCSHHCHHCPSLPAFSLLELPYLARQPLPPASAFIINSTLARSQPTGPLSSNCGHAQPMLWQHCSIFHACLVHVKACLLDRNVLPATCPVQVTQRCLGMTVKYHKHQLH